MWKDWFFYTRAQRRVIVLILVLFVLLIFLLTGEKMNKDRIEIIAEPLLIADSLYTKVETERIERERKYKSKTYRKEWTTSEKDKKQSISPAKVVDDKIRKDSFKFPKQEKYSTGIIIDVNTADTSILKKIPGIGRVISRNIVNYRNRLGGFYDVSQLLEVKYVDSTLLAWFQVKSDVFRKINVNRADIDELRSHPYMDFYKAKAIVDFRRKRGRISGMSQISMFKEFTKEDIARLSHYFSFE